MKYVRKIAVVLIIVGLMPVSFGASFKVGQDYEELAFPQTVESFPADSTGNLTPVAVSVFPLLDESVNSLLKCHSPRVFQSGLKGPFDGLKELLYRTALEIRTSSI